MNKIIATVAIMSLIGNVALTQRVIEKTTLSNDEIHKWAAEIIDREFPQDRDGYYDVCYRRIAVRETLSFDVQNACAIMLQGAEW